MKVEEKIFQSNSNRSNVYRRVSLNVSRDNNDITLIIYGSVSNLTFLQWILVNLFFTLNVVSIAHCLFFLKVILVTNRKQTVIWYQVLSRFIFLIHFFFSFVQFIFFLDLRFNKKFNNVIVARLKSSYKKRQLKVQFFFYLPLYFSCMSMIQITKVIKSMNLYNFQPNIKWTCEKLHILINENRGFMNDFNEWKYYKQLNIKIT